MTREKKPSTALSIALWAVQILLCIGLGWAAFTKTCESIETLSAMWPWTGEVSPSFVRFLGYVDLAGAIGILIPALLKMNPILTPLAAFGVVLLMLSAAVFHISRGEIDSIGINIVFGILALFVAWGRFKKAPHQQGLIGA